VDMHYQSIYESASLCASSMCCNRSNWRSGSRISIKVIYTIIILIYIYYQCFNRLSDNGDAVFKYLGCAPEYDENNKLLADSPYM
jgi:hypothetical protein